MEDSTKQANENETNKKKTEKTNNEIGMTFFMETSKKQNMTKI